MSLLASITIGGEPQPPRVVVYGPDGIGKTTFAASAPQPIVQRTEDGLKTIRVPTFPKVATSYADVMQGMHELATTDHPFLSYILDSLDWFEPLVWRATCDRLGVPTIESVGYGKGYIEADKEWRDFLSLADELRDRGMAVIFTGHAEIKRFDAPDSDPYDRYQVKLHTRGAKLVREWADVVGFAKWEVFTRSADVGFNKAVTRGTGTGQRLLAVEERPAYHAKNRYQLPPELPLSWAVLEQHVSAAISQPLVMPDWLRGAAREEREEVAALTQPAYPPDAADRVMAGEDVEIEGSDTDEQEREREQMETAGITA